MSRIRSYSELRRLDTFEDRFHYLELKGIVGTITFGFDRWINQRFYHSREWKDAKRFVVVRDSGCDLGIPGYEIVTGLLVHHMNPITPHDIIHGEESIFDPEYLICTSLETHNAIHYGEDSYFPRGPIERKAGDTKLW
ncbi:MAG TPA: hypothetical protein VGE97_09215 [Nitrososphaera sp.]